MKALLIRLFILQTGVVSLVGFCLISLMFLHLPQAIDGGKADSGGDSFPGQRRGGGTHWIEPIPQVV